MLYQIKEFALIIAMTLFIAALGYAFYRFLPTQHNPFKPLELTDPIGMATYDKLTSLKYDQDMCKSALERAGVEVAIVAPDDPGGRCSLDETFTLQRSLTPYSAAPLRMTCHQIAALHVWERHVARPLAEDLFDSPLRQIQTFGSFSCRNIAGTRTRSQHSYANAIDIAGFVLEDGREISVLDHWREDSDRGRYLHEVHEGACRLFSVTLGPDYDAAHADHFHFDMGSAETCG
ncbi:MAG: extensin family protein [Pseudomonadota bacterium]